MSDNETVEEYKYRIASTAGKAIAKKLGKAGMAELGKRGMAKRWKNHKKKTK